MSVVGPVESSCLISLQPYLPNPHASNASSPTSKDLPHVTLTYAQTLDSKISLHPNTRTNISGADTKAMTHYLRTRHDAILVGVGTANADDPGLNSRYSTNGTLPNLEHQPRPIILDSRMKWQPTSESKVLELAKRGLGKAPWWIVNHGQIARNQDRVRMIRGIGGEVFEVRPRDWSNILASLRALGIQSLMVEGGADIINGLLEARNQKYVPSHTLWALSISMAIDTLDLHAANIAFRFVTSTIITVGPSYFGLGGTAINPPRSVQDKKEVSFKDVKWIPMGEDVVMAGRLSLYTVYPSERDFEEPAMVLAWPRGGDSLHQEYSTVDVTYSPI